MRFPPHLLDEFARAFARVALDRLLEEQAARKPRQEGAAHGSPREPEVQDIAESDREG